jgi:hypothetical protein
MPSDNALLPPIIHLGYLTENDVIDQIQQARESIRFVGPGLQKAAAIALANQWIQLGPDAVEVILDADPELCRLGFCDGESLRILFDTASQLGAIVGHHSGIRLCVLEIDGVRIVYAPTPRLVEESKPQSAEIVLSPNPGEGLHEQILAPRSAAATSLTNTEVKAIENNLKESPPQDFDLARQVRVLSTEFQFVEFSLKGAALSRKRVDVPTDLLGLAPDAETEELLRANFQLIAKADEVSGESLLKRRAEIERKYLINIAHYGAVILKSNREAFQEECRKLDVEIAGFQQKAESQLDAAIAKNCATVCERLLPSVETKLPDRWIKIIGLHPTTAQRKERLEKDLKSAYGAANKHLGSITLKVIYKDVTSEMLSDPGFKKAASAAKIDIDQLHARFQAARARE